MTVKLFITKNKWLSYTGQYDNVISDYGATKTVLDNGQIKHPHLTYDASDIASIGDGWATWSGGYGGQVVISTDSSMTINLSGAVAFGFELEPNIFQNETFVITLSDGETLTENIGGKAGAKFFGFVGSDIKSITITDQSGDNFAIGNFYVQHTLGLDYRLGATQASDPLTSAAKTAGKVLNFVGEYLGGDSSYLTAQKAHALTAAGVQIFSIYETHAMSLAASFESDAVAFGRKVGKAAYADAVKVGQDQGSAIYFAIDFDPGHDAALLKGIADFFKGVAKGYQAEADLLSGHSGSEVLYKIGVYGAGVTDAAIKGAGLATYSWLAELTGWTGSNGYTDWNIRQVADPGHRMAHNLLPTIDLTKASYDALDLVNGDDFGQWGAPSAAPPPNHPVATAVELTDGPGFNNGWMNDALWHSAHYAHSDGLLV